jgi:SAM-dependent MidA family methyltransferase
MHVSEQTVSGNPELIEVIRGEIAAAGKITFARFMELALYHPEHGYYLTEARRPGRGGDFLTAPEASAYFGLTLARQIGECWERLGRPERFVIREYGSGIGGLAYDVIAGLSEAHPGIQDSLQYRLVEPNAHRMQQALAAFDEVGLGAIVSAETASPDDLGPITGVVLANEVADALPVHRLIVRDGRLRERYVAWSDHGFVEVEDDLSPESAGFPAYFARHAVALVEGGAYDVSPAASDWFERACRGIERGYSIVIDYGYDVTTLFQGHRLEGTIRAYREHTVTGDPFQFVGDQDLTAHVDFTALAEAGARAGMTPAGLTTQGAFLASLGLGERLLDLQRDPDASLADYVAAQTVVMRLIDPAGLGRFGVQIMAKGAPNDPPLLGFAQPPPRF